MITLAVLGLIGAVGYFLWRYFYTAPGCKIQVKFRKTPHSSYGSWMWRVLQDGKVFIESNDHGEWTRLGARFVAAREVRRFYKKEDTWKEV